MQQAVYAESGAQLLVLALLVAVELSVICVVGRYASRRLYSAGTGFGVRGPGDVFYIANLPGVVMHEVSHLLAALILFRRVTLFRPFWPVVSADGRSVELGRVECARGSAVGNAFVGLAPMVFNPIAIVLATAALTPLGLPELARGGPGALVGSVFGLITSDFPTQSPLACGAWLYLSLSFAMCSVPSRVDLRLLPAAAPTVALILAGCVGVGVISDEALLSWATLVCGLAAQLYALPAFMAFALLAVVGPPKLRLMRLRH